MTKSAKSIWKTLKGPLVTALILVIVGGLFVYLKYIIVS